MIVTCWMQTVYEKSCLSLTTSSIMKTLLLVCTLPKKYSLPFVKGTLEIHPPGRNFPQWIFSAGVLTQNIQVPIIPVVSSLLISPRFDCAVNVPSLHSCFRCEIEIFAHSRFRHYFCSNLYGSAPRGPRGVKRCARIH